MPRERIEREPKPVELIPTAPIGFPVRWLDPRRSFRPLPAVVLEEEDEPGSVALVVLGASNRVVRGVRHASHPHCADDKHPNVVNYGKWEYMPETVAPKSHFRKHEDLLRKKEERAAAAAREQAEIARQYQEEMAKPADLTAAEVSRIHQMTAAAMAAT
jgi:hypothetical protein